MACPNVLPKRAGPSRQRVSSTNLRQFWPVFVLQPHLLLENLAALNLRSHLFNPCSLGFHSVNLKENPTAYLHLSLNGTLKRHRESPLDFAQGLTKDKRYADLANREPGHYSDCGWPDLVIPRCVWLFSLCSSDVRVRRSPCHLERQELPPTVGSTPPATIRHNLWCWRAHRHAVFGTGPSACGAGDISRPDEVSPIPER